MVFVAALVALHVALFALAAIDDELAKAALPILDAAAACAALLIPSARRALIDALVRYWPVALAFAALIALTGAHGALKSRPDGNGVLARAEMQRLVGFGLCALTTAAATLASGRRTMRTAIVIAAIALGAFAVAKHMQDGRALLASADEAGALFALLVGPCALAVAEAMQPRPARPLARRQTRAQRFFLPASGLAGALIGLALADSLAVSAALAGAVVALTAALALRERRRSLALALLSGIGLLALVGAAALFYALARGAGGHDPGAYALGPHAPPVDARGLSTLPGATLWRSVVASLAALSLLVTLAVTSDKRRRPSRGLGLAAAGLAIVVLSGGLAPLALDALALVLGLAAAHSDELERVSRGSRNSDPP